MSNECWRRSLERFAAGSANLAAMSCVSSGSLTMDEKEAWRILQKELQNIGITPDLFTQHRRLILETLGDFMTQCEIIDFHKDLEAEETSEAAVINPDSSVQAAYQKLTAREKIPLTGRQLDTPATGSKVEPKKRLNIMARLASRMMRRNTGKSTAPLQFQNHGVCMVCLEDIEVPDPSTLASINANNVPKDLPDNLIHWKYMATDCEHTFHIHCWEKRLEFPSRCPICYQLMP